MTGSRAESSSFLADSDDRMLNDPHWWVNLDWNGLVLEASTSGWISSRTVHSLSKLVFLDGFLCGVNPTSLLVRFVGSTVAHSFA